MTATTAGTAGHDPAPGHPDPPMSDDPVLAAFVPEEPDDGSPDGADGPPDEADAAPDASSGGLVGAVLASLPDGVVVTTVGDEIRAGVVADLLAVLAAQERPALAVAPDPATAAAWRERLGERAPVHRPAAGFTGTEDEIADRIAATHAEDGWLTDLLGTDVPGEVVVPLDGAELTELRRLLEAEHGTPRALDPARRRQTLPPPAELPPEEHLEQLAEELLLEAGPPGSPARESVRPLVGALAALPPAAGAALDPTCRRIDEAVMALGRAGDDVGWARGVVDAVLAGRAGPAWSRMVAAVRLTDAVPEHDRGSGSAQVGITDPELAPGPAAEAFERFAAFLHGGGSARRLFKPEEQRAVEVLLPGLAVDHADPLTAEGAAAIGHHLRLREVEGAVGAAAAGLGRPVRAAEQRALLVHQLTSVRELSLRIGAALGAVDRLRGLLVTLPPAVRPPTDGRAAIGRIVAVTRRITVSPTADLARRELGDVVARLQGDGNPADQAPELRAAVVALARLDPDAYAEAVDAVENARVEQRDLRRSDALADRLTGWPALREALEVDTTDATWQLRERRWSQAWARYRAARWLAHRRPGDGSRVTTTTALAGRETEVPGVVVVALPDDPAPDEAGPWGPVPGTALPVDGPADDDPAGPERRLLVRDPRPEDPAPRPEDPAPA